MAEIVPFSRWRHSLICSFCEDGEVCRCTDDIKTRLWVLTGTTGVIQQFLGEGPYYGTWREGRTGAVTALDDCKRMVEEAVWHG